MKSHGSSARLLLFFASILLSLAVFEVFCRAVAVDYNPSPNWRYHPVLGWSQEPGKKYDVVIDGSTVRVEFNSSGFRDIERTFEKRAGTRRIVVVGDSFSEAIQVHRDETYFYQLEARLNRSSSIRWEVINLGVGDFSTFQELIALREFGLRYRPDLVILQVFPLNDICNNTLELAGLCKSWNDLYRPYPILKDGRLETVYSVPLRHRLRASMITFGLLERTLLRIRYRDLDPDREHRERWTSQGLPDDPLILTFAEDAESPALLRQGWKMTESILTEFDRLLRSQQIPWIAVVVPFEVQVGPKWERFASDHPLISRQRDYPEQRLCGHLESLQVPCVPVLETFLAHQEEYFPNRGGHWNPRAHLLAAEAILPRVNEALP